MERRVSTLHFAKDTGRPWYEGDPTETLCGRKIDWILMKDTVPTCETCRKIWTDSTGWSFPLPEIVGSDR